MIGFESYSVSAWFDNVLTRHVKIQKKTSPSPRQYLKNASIAALLALGSNTFQSVAVAEPTMIKIPSSSNGQSKYHPKLGDLVPQGYWPKLIAEMESWEKLAEPSIEYPDED